jgi:hypothetical protein
VQFVEFLRQHDSENQKHQDASHIDHHLGPGEKIRTQKDIKAGNAEKGKQQGKGGVDQIAREHHDPRRQNGHAREKVKDDLGQQIDIHNVRPF